MDTYLLQHPDMAGWVGLGVAFIESLAIIGTLVPSALTFFPLGYLIGKGVIPKSNTFIMICIGALLGDYLSYIVGLKGKSWLEKKKIFTRFESSLQKGKVFFEKYGVASILIGRFVGPLRSSIPFFAGILEMKHRLFLIAVLPTVLLWAFVYLIPGYLVGAFAMNLSLHTAYEFGLYLLIIMSLYALVHRKTRLRKWLSYALFAAKKEGQKLLRFQHMIFSFLLFISFTCAVTSTQSIIEINKAIWFFMQSIRTPFVDSLCIWLSAFAWKYSLIPACLSLTAVLLCLKRNRCAALFIVHAFFAAISIQFLKTVIGFQRPSHLSEMLSPSFPSGHVALLTFLVIALHCLIMHHQSLQRYSRWVGSSLIVFTIICRIYLGVHWFTDVIGGFLLGCFWGHCFEYFMIKKPSQPKEPTNYNTRLIVCIPLLTIIVFAAILYPTLNKSQKNIDRNITQYILHSSQPEWRLFNRFHQPSGVLNIRWSGFTIDEIEQTLHANQWQTKEHHISIVKRLIDQLSSNQHLDYPLFSESHLNHNPILIMTNKNHQTVKLWQSNRPHTFIGTVYQKDQKNKRAKKWVQLKLDTAPFPFKKQVSVVVRNRINKEKWDGTIHILSKEEAS